MKLGEKVTTVRAECEEERSKLGEKRESEVSAYPTTLEK